VATNHTSPRKPVVLVLSGHDPTGAAGIQADIESIAATGSHSVSVITSLTAQNTACFEKIYPLDAQGFRKQAQLLLSDIHIHACKIGLIGDALLAEVIAELLAAETSLPVVLDPVIAAGTGENIASQNLLETIKLKLLPLTTILTPNTREARQLTGLENINHCADQLLQYGCKHVLITGADEKTRQVTNILFSQGKAPESFVWERLRDQYHGSGCTLSSSISGYIAQGNDVREAVEKGQEYTWNTLVHGQQLGQKQKHPDRFYAHKND